MPARAPGGWRWFHHLLVVLAVVALTHATRYFRPSDQVANSLIITCAIVVVASVIIVRLRRRR